MMKFTDYETTGDTRTAFHQLDADVQIAIEELVHTLAGLGFMAEITLNDQLEIIIRQVQ
jgi:predicted ArsR family transcriptional regulator